MNRAEWVKRLSQFPYDDLRQKILENWAFDVATLERDLAATQEALAVTHQIGDSFWAAIKPLELAAINVGNPGSHVTDVIHERDEARKRVAILEEEDREWDKHSLTKLVEERGALQERVKVLTGALVSEYLAGVEWGIKHTIDHWNLPMVSWDAGFPAMKAQALLDRSAREQAKETTCS